MEVVNFKEHRNITDYDPQVGNSLVVSLVEAYSLVASLVEAYSLEDDLEEGYTRVSNSYLLEVAAKEHSCEVDSIICSLNNENFTGICFLSQ